MNSIELATRSLFKKGRHDGMKIISLGVGLAVALVLVAKMYFEQSFDKFYPDTDRIYRLAENFTQRGSDEVSFGARSWQFVKSTGQRYVICSGSSLPM